MKKQINMTENILNAKQAGLSIDVLLFTCRAQSIESQLGYIVKNLGTEVVDRYWILPYLDYHQHPECSWDLFTPDSTCQYLQQFLTHMKNKYDLDGGVAVRLEHWLPIFKNRFGCE